ncbi:unnamed protein product [Adineta ricciae]|uniref:SHSP domain-containing protein n=1 Tax=Adineta ricciae TaxID=249248 RepID=A0A813MGK6_ADIRI|nr:unnamed protein product [Adineta ricciae]CAF0785101.1 unnamed protein product [Adineta ricciae]
MNRYYSDRNQVYYTNRQNSGVIQASGWQTPIPNASRIVSSQAPFIRLVVDCPFGFKKCDYTIDKSQPGRLIVAARRRHRFKSDYFLLNDPNQVTYQTFTIPGDADVDQLQSHIERSTNRLIIEIPRLPLLYNQSPDNTQWTYDNKKYSQKYVNNNQKVEYRVDCRGYTADQLKVYVQGRDLIVQGKTSRSSSSAADPNQQRTSQKFSRKIPLTNAVDSSQIISYFENGDLIIQAPLKSDDAIMPSSVPIIINRSTGDYVRAQSPTPTNTHHYQQQRRDRSNLSRTYGPAAADDDDGDRRPLSPIRREQSAESLAHPSYRLSRDFEENRPKRTTIQERYFNNNRSDSPAKPIGRSVYYPTNNVVTTRTTYHTSPGEVDFD